MRYLYKIFFENNKSDFEDIYQKRYHFDSTVHIGLYIKPMNQPEKFELFYIPTNEILNKISNVYRMSREFTNTLKQIPKVAQQQFINECLVEELFNTNDLEGIRSTREEIARSAKSIQLNKKTSKRFESMIKSYLRLLNQEFELPKHAQNIRQIYDDITSGEIDEQELPDGNIFRKENTFVLKKSGTSRVIHKGTLPETKIIEEIDQLLEFMNQNQEIPNIIKVAIGHYYFGYIHPFYDGNGRTSRFISSLFIINDLDNVSALSLSRGCNKYRNKYLESFEVTNSIRSRGEMNFFIETFFDILIDTLTEMTAELKEKYELLNIASRKLADEPMLKNRSSDYMDILFILAQNYFFDSNIGLTIRELAEIIEKSDATVRKVIKDLIDELLLIEQTGERPAYYSIKQQYIEE